MNRKRKLSIITPILNEQEIILDFWYELKKVIKKIKDFDFEIILIDDGSKDNSFFIAKKLQKKDKRIKIIRFAKNFGQQAAIMAGLEKASGDIIAVLDADLQDPPKYILEFVEKWQKGAKIVYAKREERKDNVFKKITAFLFYRTLNLMIRPKIQVDVGDFYLLDNKVVEEIKKLKKKRLFLRGIINRLDFPKKEILIKREARKKGKGSYTFLKMIKLSIDAFIILLNIPIKNQKKPLYVIKELHGFKESKKIAVLGGGISGLACAYYLSKMGYKIVVFEKSDSVGGLLDTVQLNNGKKIEKFYHHIFKTDSEAINLLSELDLLNHLKWHKSNTGVFKNGEFYDFNSPSDLLKLPFLSFLSKIRMGLTTLFLSNTNNYHQFENITAKRLILKYMGKEVWNKFWKPLFEGKFSSNASKISGAWFWARINKRAKSRDNRQEELGYLKNSFSILIDKLKKVILENGSDIKTNCKIDKVKYSNSKFLLSKEKFDILISTIPINELTEIAPLEKSEKNIFNKVKYTGAICVLIESKKKLTDYYWTNILDEMIPFKGIIEHTNLTSSNKYNGKHLIYLSHYLNNDTDLFQKDKKELQRFYLNHLKTIFPKIKKDIVKISIFKAKYAQPIIPANFTPLKRKMSQKNFYVTSIAHIYPYDRGINYAIKEAKKIVKLIDNPNKV